MRTEIAPGPWLRLSAIVAAGGTLLAVISGAEGLGTAHRLLAALVAPPLAALVVSAWCAHRRLVPATLASAALFAAAAAVPGPRAHAGLAARSDERRQTQPRSRCQLGAHCGCSASRRRRSRSGRALVT